MRQSNFMLSVTHELKTPLTVIVGFLETLSDMKNEFNEKTRPYLKMMLEQSDRMRKLVEDLLKLSQYFFAFEGITIKTI
mgnify:CR=1 FL=1